MSDMFVGVDMFATAIDSILDDVERKSKHSTRKAVRKSCKLGKERVKKNTRNAGLHQGKTYKKYESGWTYKTTDDLGVISGEIGNSNVPGLPHLIEKGHARVGGGRVAGRIHIKTAADYTFKVFEREVSRGIEEAIS